MITRFPDSKDDELNLATWLNDQGFFEDMAGVISYFEKPWKFQGEWKMYRNNLAIGAYLDRLRLDHIFTVDGFDLVDGEICVKIRPELRNEHNCIRGVWWVDAEILLRWLRSKRTCDPQELVDQLNFYTGRAVGPQSQFGIVA